jgi:hypothetical protein
VTPQKQQQRQQQNNSDGNSKTTATATAKQQQRQQQNNSNGQGKVNRPTLARRWLTWGTRGASGWRRKRGIARPAFSPCILALHSCPAFGDTGQRRLR